MTVWEPTLGLPTAGTNPGRCYSVLKFLYSVFFFNAIQQILCKHVNKCERLRYQECLGATLPYSHTSLNIARLHSQMSAKVPMSAYHYS